MKALVITMIMMFAMARAEHEADAPQKDGRGRELPTLLPKHVDEDGHASTHADMIDPLHAASLLFPDELIERIECKFESEHGERRRFRMNTKK